MARSLKINEAVTFGDTGNIKDFEPYGFDLSEPKLSWTQEDVAGLWIAALPNESVVALRVAAIPFLHANRVQQQFFVFANGLYVGFRAISEAVMLDLPFPRSALHPKGIRIEFAIPTAASPRSLGISSDLRKLGIALTSLQFVATK